MLHTKAISLLLWAWMACLVVSIPPPMQDCDCGLFLRDDLWSPNHLALSLANDLKIDCSNINEATDMCKSFCANEMASLADLFQRNPRLLREYPPSQSLPCHLLPKETVSFAKVCHFENYVLAARELGPAVCCDKDTGKPIWCGANGDISYVIQGDVSNQIAESRKLDLKKDPNDESHNEIDDVSDVTKLKVTLKNPSKSPSNSSNASWTKSALKFFGYNSFGDLVSNIDIFSLPTKVQYAVKTYRDEVSMGRCYMEFTTFKVFTRQENPFDDLLRKRRDTAGDITRFDEFSSSSEVVSQTPRSHNKDQRGSQNESVMRILGVVSSLLERSESTKPYASMLNTFLPFVANLVPGNDGAGSGGAPSPLSMIMKLAGPILSQMGDNAAPVSNSIEPLEKLSTSSNTGPSSSSSPGNNQFATMAMSMIGNVIKNYFSSGGDRPTQTKAQFEEVEIRTTTTESPRQPPKQMAQTASAPNQDFLSNAISTLMKMFLQRGSSDEDTSGSSRPVETQKPVRQPTTAPAELEKQEPKTFIDILLELIRPIFISIVGNAPGDSGEKEIRRVSTLSTLGRVDDTLKEEVDSPLFCLKKYMVNKAWSLTETGVRTIVSKFTPEEQERMMQRMLS